MPPKKKAEPGTQFKGVDGKTYTLPPLSPRASLKVPAGLTMDMLENPDDDFLEMRHSLALLKANETPAEITSALRALDTGDMLKVVSEWLGESRGSSPQSDATEEPSSSTSEADSTSA